MSIQINISKLFLFLFLFKGVQIFGQVSYFPVTAYNLPEGYVLFEKIEGDFNNDGLEDCILLIKGTDKDKLVINHFDKEVDRNRRGIIVLFNNNGKYELVAENHDCFESENEDGGVYFPPELAIEIKKGNLNVKYHHGRYGEWKYIFRYQNSDFELIGYDSVDGAVVIKSETSINFLTKRKLVKTNTNLAHDEGGEEVFEENWSDIKIDSLIKLSKINDFFELDMHKY